MTNAKMTKKEMFAQIRSHLTDVNEIAFIDHEIELLNRKNSAKSNAPTKTQKENAQLAELVLEFMQEGEKYTISELQKGIPALSELSNQKVTGIIRGLSRSELVKRTEEKGKAYFSKA